jgi:hypothetical protein
MLGGAQARMWVHPPVGLCCAYKWLHLHCIGHAGIAAGMDRKMIPPP